MQRAELGLNLSIERTRNCEFLAQMERVVPWAQLEALIAPHALEGRRGRPPFSMRTILRIHFMQQWFSLSDPPMEEALHEVRLFREFSGLNYEMRLPDESTHQRFRHLLEEHKLAEQILQTVNLMLQAKGLLLKAGTVVDATLIAAPGSANVVGANGPLHGEEADAFGDADNQGAAKRPEGREDVQWHVGMRSGKRHALDKTRKVAALVDQVERLKASIRAKVEHPFRVNKRQFGHMMVRYRGLKKNTAQLRTPFALSNMWMARPTLLAPDGHDRPKVGNAT